MSVNESTNKTESNEVPLLSDDTDSIPCDSSGDALMDDADSEKEDPGEEEREN